MVQHLIMQFGAVALVFGKLILGILVVQFTGHVTVPADLRQNGRRSDGGAFPVTAHDGHVGRCDSVDAAVVPVAIDKGQVRLH